MSEHSKGPWIVEVGEQNIGEPLVSVKDAEGEVICDNETYYPKAIDPRNANLIASAPELLAFAEHVKKCILANGEYAPISIEYVTTVVAKAKGVTQ